MLDTERTPDNIFTVPTTTTTYSPDEYMDICTSLYDVVQKYIDKAITETTVTTSSFMFMKSLHAEYSLTPTNDFPYGMELHAVANRKGVLSTYRIYFLQKVAAMPNTYISMLFMQLYKNQGPTMNPTFITIDPSTHEVTLPTDNQSLTELVMNGEQAFEYLLHNIYPYLQTATVAATKSPENTAFETYYGGRVI